MNLKRFSVVMIGLLFVVGAQTAYSATGVPNTTPSATGNSNTGTTLINPLGPGILDLPTFIKSVLDFVVYLGSIVVILMLVYVGFLFVTARGEPAKITTARQALLWTVIGALILLGAKAIAIGIQETVKAIGS